MTSLGVNVGDEFIREGIFSFLDETFENWEPFYVNKVELESLYKPLEGEKGVLNDKFRNADLIIQAGAPVYWNLGTSTSYNVEWAEALWEKRIFKLGPEKPILNIAAGACQPYPDFPKTFLADPLCAQFAKKAATVCRWTSARDPLTSHILYSLEVDHDVLPCTAFHAARRVRILKNDSNLIGMNLMPLGGHYKLKDDIEEGSWKNKIGVLLSQLRKWHRLLFIAHDPAEKEFMGRYMDTGETLFYSSDFREYVNVYAQCAAVIANRVHGAVCSAGFGNPSIILGNDTRLLIGDYIGIPSYYISHISPEEIIEQLEESISSRKFEKQRLLSLREESASRYREAIHENCSELFGEKEMKHPKKERISVKQMNLSLGSVKELSSKLFADFMTSLNCFAQRWGLRQFTNWSKVWEYPWLWFNGLSQADWKESSLLDIGSELSPMTWFLASLGANVTLVEMDQQWVPKWERLCTETGLQVKWQIVPAEKLPFEDESFDVVTSFSVIEHQKDKGMAVNEVLRILKPGGLLALSFDICEPEMSMTFPDWNGKALTMAQFEELIWNHPEFDTMGQKPEWNVRDIPEFIKWHLQSASHHNYTVGAAALRKRLS